MSVKFAIIGHIAFNRDITPFGDVVSIGGSAYYCGIGASLANPSGAGIVSVIGNDFNKNSIKSLNIDSQGIASSETEKTAEFVITQLEDGSRLFKAQWGVAENVRTDIFPESYSKIEYAHLATAPPHQYLKWIEMLRGLSQEVFISIDTFEYFAVNYPKESREAIRLADFVFINEEERNLLELDINSLNKPYVLKLGAKGAIYCNGLKKIHAKAPKVKAVDTTGAGDILAGAFLALVSNNKKEDFALKMAVEIASLSTESFGVNHLLDK